jgi:hypothetical protein
MSLRDKLRQNSQPYLEQGETVQAVFNAQTGPNPYLSIITYLFLFWVRLYAVVVTDRRILVLRSSFWRPSVAVAQEAVWPRATRLGPVSGLWAKLNQDLNGKDVWVHRRFHKDVDSADAQAGGGSQLPAPAAAAAAPAAAWQAPPIAAPPTPEPPPSPQPAAPAASHPADWYPDPRGEARLRYWDGSAWTSHTSN